MIAYVGRRMIQMIPLVFGISIVLFAVIQAAPGGPEGALLETGRFIDPEVIEAYRERLGVDQPVPVQYVRWIGGAVRGDLGISFSTTRPVSEMIIERLPATLELMGASFLLAALLAFALGTISAVKQYSWFDHLGTGFSFVGIAMPVFWFALILQMVFGVWLQWLPVAGTQTVGATSVADHLLHLVLPTVVLSLRYVAGWSRYLRSSLLVALRTDYVRTARAKGLSEVAVVGVHAARNALIPVVSVMALNLAGLFSGAVITETIFAWPGIGQYITKSLFNADMNAVIGGTVVVGIGFVGINMLSDVLYRMVDPRARR